jgi:membrane protease YdiL (CAAX protease family)
VLRQYLAALYQWFSTAFIKILVVWCVAYVLTIVSVRLFKTDSEPSNAEFMRPRREATISLLVMAVVFPLLFPINLLIDRASDASLIERLLVQVAAQLLMCSPAIFALVIRRQGPETVGLARRNLPQLLLLGACLATVTALLFAVMPIPGENPPAQDKPLTMERCAFVISTMAVSALAHEFVYRGYLQTRLTAWGGELGGLLLSSLVYTLWHLPRFLGVFNWLTILVQTFSLFVLGLVLGEIRRRTGSIIPSACFHAANDIALTIW